MLASFVDTISDSPDGAGSTLELDLSVAWISVSNTDAVKSVDTITNAGVSVDSICDSPGGASFEHDFSVASNSLSTDAGESVDTISDSPDVAGSHRLSSSDKSA
jgi:hypothetical protein